MQICQSTERHTLSGVITGAILAGLLSPLVATPTHAATTTVHTATAFGAQVQKSGANNVKPVAEAELPGCSTSSALSDNASADSVTSGLVTTGAVTSNAYNTADIATAVTKVAAVNLLGGMITATKVDAVSTSSVSGSVFESSAAGSKFTDLVVNGVPMAADVAPNTVITLPSLGTVTLNEQTPAQSSDKSTLTVVMIHVSITQGANAGTDIVVGDALSEIKSLNVPATVGGYAYSPELFGPGDTNVVGREVEETIPCYGTSGVPQTDSYPYGTLSGLWTAGTVTATGVADLSATETSVETTTSIANLVLLSEQWLPQGPITATSITSEAIGTTTDGVTFNFSGASTFVGLSVPGYPAITDDVAPNTEIHIPNLGDIYFNVVEIEADLIKITPIKLVITAKNSSLGPYGYELTVGAAEAQLHSTDHP